MSSMVFSNLDYLLDRSFVQEETVTSVEQLAGKLNSHLSSLDSKKLCRLMFKRLNMDLRENIPSPVANDLHYLRFKNIHFLAGADSENTLCRLKGTVL